ncbi:GNAT family N-acetyltransferase [Limosilactobacillus ingluviei]|uniref:GNAT family N-acetyltransferase n=1 Tax=Limosilactobacillus ingluviei TaxID=148604 RepID=UPI0024B8979E|nr:GNAT family N-acetyltransferase [Limosilactobacillus ingluviei]
MQNQQQAKLKGRWLAPADLAAVMALLADEALTQAAGLTLAPDPALRQWAVSNWLQERYLWGLWAGAQLVGVIATFPLAEAEWALGYLLAPAWQGHGLMTAAVATFLRANPTLALVAQVAATNRASQRVLKHNGFQLLNQGAVCTYRRGRD